jgi:cell division protein FtsL
MSLLTTLAPERRPRPVTDPPPRRARPPLRLVEPPSTPKRRVRVGLVGSLVFGLVILGVFALAAVHTLVVQAQFELDRLDQQVADRQGQLDALRLRVATLESPAHVAEAAAAIGMVTPAERIHLEPVVHAPTPRDRDAPPNGVRPDDDLAAGQLVDGP